MERIKKILTPTVIVSALGYFVDIFDLVLFSILRVPSLKDLGLTPEEILTKGVWILNSQMAGFMVGGVFFGIIGDKIGRKQALFGSIFLYSIANILNAFVFDPWSYMIIRFFAGMGLAGELGGAITLVNEVLDKENRGWGATVVASFGVSGAIFAGIFAEFLHWRAMYFLGGILGLILLFFRFKVYESSMFEKVKRAAVKRGDLILLFSSWDRVMRFFKVNLVGLPIWYSIALAIVLSPEMGKVLGVKGQVSASIAVAVNYAGLTVGDFISGSLSQILKSRKKAILIFLFLLILFLVLYYSSRGVSLQNFYFLCFLIGVGAGYWVVFITTAAENFGTNLRATVATITPNFIRFSVVPITSAFLALKPHLGMLGSAAVIGVICFAIAFLSWYLLEETYGKDLDFIEE